MKKQMIKLDMQGMGPKKRPRHMSQVEKEARILNAAKKLGVKIGGVK